MDSMGQITHYTKIATLSPRGHRREGFAVVTHQLALREIIPRPVLNAFSAT